jgi:hypothetical protein
MLKKESNAYNQGGREIMKRRICLALVLAVGLLVGGFSASALATCYKLVKVIKVKNYDNVSHVVFGQELYSVLPGYVWYWTIKNDNLELLNAAQAAYVSGAPARIDGDAATCPNTGESRNGGYVTSITLTGK